MTGHDHFPVYVDSPLAVEATEFFPQCDHTDFDDETRAILKQGVNPIWFDGLKLAVSPTTKLINTDPQPKVILRQRHVRGGQNPPPSEGTTFGARKASSCSWAIRRRGLSAGSWKTARSP